jgi:NAD(P)-dependent dehydrogenase (short-subunit alcohol dehydrogenase family)
MGAFHVVQAAIGPMIDAQFGRIVLTSSIGGLYGNANTVNYAMSKAAMLGLANVASLEGEDADVSCNLIVPGAVTRMAEGLDISQYPPMDTDLVAPLVGWLSHQDCTVSGELLSSMAGRISRLFVAETRGVYRPSWTIEDVAANTDGFRDKGPESPQLLDLGLHGYMKHLGYSFEMAREGVTL